MTWECPECSSDRLSVTVVAEARLWQSEDNFETEVVGDHEWDHQSAMTCHDCGFYETSNAFEVEP